MRRTVLVVDDDPTIADGYAARLADEYDVETRYGGHEALDRLAEGDIGVLLLDRRMPDMDGDEVLERLGSEDERPRVAMLTGVEPTAEVASMPFDDYLRKPVSKQALLATVEDLFARATCEGQLRHFFATASKLAALERESDPAELRDDPRYDRLRRRFREQRRALDDRLADLDADRFAVALGDESAGGNDDLAFRVGAPTRSD